MKDWKKTLIPPDTSLATIIKIMDREALGIVIVTDSQHYILGVVTDGDIRRSLIKHMSMEIPAKDIMCRTPKLAHTSWSRKKALEFMEHHQLLQLPVVNDKGQIVDLKTLHVMLQKEHRDTPVFLMAGGFGTRLRPLTNTIPKPMLKVGDRPILELILNRFIEEGFSNFYISTHYMPEKIIDYFGDGSSKNISIQYVNEKAPLGTAGALGLLPDDLPDTPLIVMNGDLLTKVKFDSLLKFHEESDALATLCVREYDFQVPYGVVQAEAHHVKDIIEKPVHKFFVNAGIYVIAPSLYKQVSGTDYLDMPDFLQQQIDLKQSINMYPIHESWIDIGRMKDFKQAQVAEVLG